MTFTLTAPFLAERMVFSIMTDNKKATLTPIEAPVIRRIIGKTTYIVSVHFNPDSKETLQKKSERLLRNEVRHADITEERAVG